MLVRFINFRSLFSVINEYETDFIILSIHFKNYLKRKEWCGRKGEQPPRHKWHEAVPHIFGQPDAVIEANLDIRARYEAIGLFLAPTTESKNIIFGLGDGYIDQ